MRNVFVILTCLIAFTSKAQVTLTDSDIPIILINTYSNTIVDEPKVASHIKILYKGPTIRNYVTDVPAYEGEIGIELHGTYSQTFPQLSYGFELRNPLGGEIDTALLGIPKEHDWILVTNYNDKAFSRNTLANNLFAKMGNYAVRSKFCEVVINGDYKGIYLLSENVKRDKNRVNIAKLDSAETTYPNVSGGYIFKNDYWSSSSDSWQCSYSPIDQPAMDVHLVYHYPKPDKIQSSQKTYLQSSVNQFETALYSANFTDPIVGYRKYADELTFIDFFILEELSRNYDGFMHSVYFSKDIDNLSISKIKCGPVWDFDWAFNNISVSNCTDFAAANGSGWAYKINDCNAHSVNSTGWHVRMLQDSGFVNLLRCRWERLRTTVLDTTYLFKHIDSVAVYLNESQARHYARWGHISWNIGGCHVGSIPTTFAGHVSQLKDWLKVRIAWLDGNLPGTSLNCTLGIREENNFDVSVLLFPSPCSNNFFIETKGFKDILMFVIYDQNGRIIKQEEIKSNVKSLVNVSDLSDGIYILRISEKNGKMFYRKLVVSQ